MNIENKKILDFGFQLLLDRKITEIATGECPSCFEEEIALTSLPCGHKLCRNCVDAFSRSLVINSLKNLDCFDCPFDKNCALQPTPFLLKFLLEEVNLSVAELVQIKFSFADLRTTAQIASALAHRFLDSVAENRKLGGVKLFICPTEDCSAFFVKNQHYLPALFGPGSKSKILSCKNCFQQACMVCGAAFHGFLSCLQSKVSLARLNAAEDAKSSAFLSLIAAQCPKCKVKLMRDKGCNHMKCFSCRYEFCMECNLDWALHDARSGGFYKCVKTVVQKREAKEKTLSQTDVVHEKEDIVFNFFAAKRKAVLVEELLTGLKKYLFGKQEINNKFYWENLSFEKNGLISFLTVFKDIAQKRKFIWQFLYFQTWVKNDKTLENNWNFMNELKQTEQQIESFYNLINTLLTIIRSSEQVQEMDSVYSLQKKLDIASSKLKSLKLALHNLTEQYLIKQIRRL